jgi:hypothetical protein
VQLTWSVVVENRVGAARLRERRETTRVKRFEAQPVGQTQSEAPDGRPLENPEQDG